MLKSTMPSLRVGWFLHTPFPTSEVFRMLPMRDDIMKGLAGADLIGFHTHQYVRHFLSATQYGLPPLPAFGEHSLIFLVPSLLCMDIYHLSHSSTLASRSHV